MAVAELTQHVAGVAWKRDPGTFAHRLTRLRPPAISAGPDPWEHFKHSDYLVRKFIEVATTPGKRMIWTIPPRHGKSLIGSIWGPLWYLEMWPGRRIITCSYGQELATTFGRDVRNLVDLYADELRVTLRQDSQAAHRWNTRQGGGMLTAGVGGAITGFGANLLVVDDPFANWQEAQSETVRNTVWGWWRSTAMTRIEPNGSALVIMTRWHEDDLVGRLEDQAAETGDEWEVVRLPAIAEEPDDKYPDPDPLGREVGEALCPERYDVPALGKLERAAGSYTWAGMFQQRPAPDKGGIFERGWWRFFTVPPTSIDLVFQSWDMSFDDKGDDPSYVVGQQWAIAGGDAYLLDQVRGQMNYPSTRATVIAFAAKWARLGAGTKLIEDKANGPAIIADLARAVPGLHASTPKGSKVARARGVSAFVQSGNVWLPDGAPWVSDFMDELAAFPNATHDDQVDAFSQALAWVAPEIVETLYGAEAADLYTDTRAPAR